MNIKGWKQTDLSDGVCLEKSANLLSCGFFLLAPLLLGTVVAFLDLALGGNLLLFGVPVHWGDEETPQPYVLFFLVAVLLAIAGREMQMRYGSEKWIARQNSLEIHKNFWGLKSVRRYVNSELSIIFCESDTSSGEKPGVHLSYLVVTSDSGKEFRLGFYYSGSEPEALEFGQILSTHTGWPLSNPTHQVL